ncbi:MAG: response regulator [Flavobacterium sp.]|nr:response regulator [Flavobacterium sp.]
MENTTIRILIADDDEGDRFIFKDALDGLNLKHLLHTVNNGLQLMEYLTKKDAVLPNIIFLDLNMPRKNGLECLKEIRNNKKFNEISIAIYSTSAAEKDLDETFCSGANVYIKKPTSFANLKLFLSKVVENAYLNPDESLERANFLLSI